MSVWRRTEASLVELDQVEIMIRGSAGGPQLVQMRLSSSKIPLIPPHPRAPV